jgi:hypothetical protein
MPQIQKPAFRYSDTINQLFWTAENQDPAAEFSPFFYAEVRIDFNDVRTGFRETISLKKAFELFSDPDLLWVADMIRDINPENISNVIPSGFCIKSLTEFPEFPEFIDEQYISKMEAQLVQYLMNRFEAKVYRNSVLNIYSFSGESLSQFTTRCLELLDGPMRQEFESLHDAFNRKLRQIKQKYLGYEDDSRESEIANEDSMNRNYFSKTSERIAGLFIHAEPNMRPVAGAFRNVQGAQELEDRLLSLELEAQQVIAKLWGSYVEKAQSVDEYVLHPNLKDIHLVRSCILWLPDKLL